MIKQSVEGYEAPFNPQAWENVSKELPDAFDHAMKDAAGNYEAPFNPAAWDAVSSQLGTSTAAWKWIAGTAAVIAVVAGSVYLFNTTQENSTSTSTNNESEVATTNDHVNNNDQTVTFTDANNQGESVAHNEVVSENNGQDPIHHINNDIQTNIEPVHVDDNGSVEDHGTQTTNDQTTTNGQNTTTNNGGSDNNQDNNNGYDPYGNVVPGFTVSSSEICQGENCVFTPEFVVKELKYTWNFGDGSFSTSAVGEHKYKKAGQYTVTLDVKNPKTNKTIASATESVVVNELPVANFNWEKTNQIIPTINFINLTNEANSWNWDIKGLKQSDKREFEYTFREAGNYVVELTAVNEYGCSKSIQKTIEIEEDYNLLAPNAFSPNGDFKNDEFIPEALKIMNNEFTMTIMDKSGNLVYTTQNANEPWDGRYTKDNTPAPAGAAYIWRVVLVNNNGEQEMYEGQVIIIR
ncbi:MAG: PKD domain-containing protein [Crocinitomicaceae bacterium]|nr:gliding motility-associated C-terminal domain-containing protein [Crocinitomicaceae bacterium]